MKVGIVLGSIREGRMGEGVARWVNDLAQSRDTGVEYELVDLKEFNVPLLESSVIPGAANKQYDNEQVQAWSDKIDSFDGFIFVTPEYNHSVPGGFKRSEEHTSELQSRFDLVCRLLLEKKNKTE